MSDETRSTTVTTRASNSVDEAKRLLGLARKMRQEVAILEGKTLAQVEEEARSKRTAQLEQQQKQQNQNLHKQQRKETSATIPLDSDLSSSNLPSFPSQPQPKTSQSNNVRNDNSYNDILKNRNNMSRRRMLILPVPETPEAQLEQAQAAVERAFKDGFSRQIIRFALVEATQTLSSQDPSWPGGAQQIYRQAAGPMTRALLEKVRASPSSSRRGEFVASSSYASESIMLRKPPVVTSRDVWDFDGSAIVRAQASTGSDDDVQALVLPNTDTKYTQDIRAMDEAMGPRLLLLVNPFWRNIDSWGFNILAPRGKQLAQEAIFDRGFIETYHVLQKSVEGEDCIAVKAYPYDWQLYARAEREEWPYSEYTVYLGSMENEPTSIDFARCLRQRSEFKLSKNMRHMQRLMNYRKNE